MEPTIYLNFKGNCLEAMRFYAATLGGEITGVFRNGDVEDAQNRMPGGDDLVLNMAMRLGSHMVMASDVPDEWYVKPQGFSVTLTPTSIADFDRLFDALADGATAVSMQPGETFWAERFSMFTDRYGTPWILNFEGRNAMR